MQKRREKGSASRKYYHVAPLKSKKTRLQTSEIRKLNRCQTRPTSLKARWRINHFPSMYNPLVTRLPLGSLDIHLGVFGWYINAFLSYLVGLRGF